MGDRAVCTARFERSFTGPASAVRARIWQQVYGPEYPSWADPFSYVSVTELRRFATSCRQPAGRPPQVSDHRPVRERAGIAEMNATLATMIRRVLVIARRTVPA